MVDAMLERIDVSVHPEKEFKVQNKWIPILFLVSPSSECVTGIPSKSMMTNLAEISMAICI